MTTKTEAASQVRQVLQSVKDRLGQPGGAKVNEASTRAHFLNPLLEALGYRSIDDIQFEYYLPDGKTFLDYRLFVDGRPRLAVEAKALDVPLTDAHAAQAVSYAAVLGDEWAVVTNAREWRLYHAFAQSPLAEKLILKADLVGWEGDAQFDSVFEQLWLIGKDSFMAGDGPGSWLATRKLDQLLRSVFVDPSSVEVKALRRHLEHRGVTVSPDQIAAWMKSRLDGNATQSVIVGKVPSPAAPYPTAGSQSSPQPSHAVASTYGSPNKPPGAAGVGKFWLIPAGKRGGSTAAEHLAMWLHKGFWGFWAATPGRKVIRPGDWACFYAAKTKQILAYGRISGELDSLVTPDEWPEPNPPEQPIYKVPLEDIVWLAPPMTVDGAIRAQLDAFRGKEATAGWAWLVQTTRRLSEADFLRLTGRS